jgi:hypothetical protein
VCLLIRLQKTGLARVKLGERPNKLGIPASMTVRQRLVAASHQAMVGTSRKHGSGQPAAVDSEFT